MSVIVVSVGTSLITNNRDCGELRKLYPTFARQLANQQPDAVRNLTFNFNGANLTVNGILFNGLRGFSAAFCQKYFDEREIKANIKHRQDGDDFLPAEISSLFLYYYDRQGDLRPEFTSRLSANHGNEFENKDRVILLTTDTPDAIYCAKMIREMIGGVSLFQVTCEVARVDVIPNLDVYNPAEWANDPFQDPDSERGIHQMLDWFEDNFTGTGRPERGERILIRTGGYKEFSADLKLFAIQYGFESFYLFERSYNFVVTYIPNWPRFGLPTIIRGITWRP